MGYVVAPVAVFLIALIIDKFIVSKELQVASVETQHIASLPEDTYFDWKKLVNYAWQIVIFFLAYELLISIDLYLVKGIMRSDYQTGIYNASITIGRIPYYLFYALTVILLPVISKTTSRNMHDETTRIITESLRLMVIMLVPSIILMSVYAKEIILLFFSKDYIDAAYPMSILVFGVGFLTIFYVLCFIMSGAEKVKNPMIISTIGLVINSILNYFLIKKYGIVGSAIATSLTSALITFIMLYYIWKDFGVALQLKSISKVILAGALMYLASLFFPTGQFIFILWSIILFAIYLLLLYITKEITPKDLFFLKKMLLKNK
jgi:O-antigen/teichoic acid export membrane protein